MNAEKYTDIIINGKNANILPNMLYRGAGMVSGNNSSRLLLDYKAEQPEKYYEILEHIFGKKGIGVTFLKLEMGSDVNSSSGTEPAVKRTEDEKADVRRGAGFQLAADAKKINPEITLDMLWWSEPKWVSDSDDIYSARYKWYKETLDSAYEIYGLRFDYVSVVRNERAADYEWIKYFSKRLKNERDCPYDYSKIKIVGGEEVCTWNFADEMLADRELLESVDVVGSHYTSMSSESAKKLAYEYKKELWFSEGSTSMGYSKGVCRFDGNGSGLSGLNGVLDIANRLIMMYASGKMTMCELQPVIAAYYDGVCYCQKQYINACDPWSGFYTLESGFFMSLHFSEFIKKGWAFIDSACYSDGKIGGDGHCLENSVYSYLTATDASSGDYSTVITNTTNEPITYKFIVSNIAKADCPVEIWETRGSDSGSYDENYFRKISTVIPEKIDNEYIFSVTVKPYSIITVSTLSSENFYINMPESDHTILALPYYDDFSYQGYSGNYLPSRGNAPRFTTDQGGAFEVEKIGGENFLIQQITADLKAEEWGATPNPTTSLGDDRWNNYSVYSSIKLYRSNEPSENYAGIGLRYCLASIGESGYWFRIFENGSYSLMRNNTEIINGKSDLDPYVFNMLGIKAVDGIICCYLNGEEVIKYAEKNAVLSAGRAAIYSSFHRNMFSEIRIEPEKNCFITRYDDTDSCCEYSGNWTHNLMSSFKVYKRTCSDGEKDAVLTVKFNGTGFAVIGENTHNSVIDVTIDGKTADKNFNVLNSGPREIAYSRNGLEKSEHIVEITVISGIFNVDSIQVTD